MANNTELDLGSGGDVIATLDVAGVKYQQVKPHIGANAGTVMSGGAGAVDGGTVRVTLASDDPGVAAMEATQAAVEGTLTVDGSGVTQPVSHAALTELGAAINASSQVDVNIAASGATVPISHAALTELAAAIDTELQVDVVSSALPSGAATLAEQQTQTTHLSNAATSLGVMDDWDNAASDGASVSGDVAHDAADAGEPVKIGGRADTTFQTAVADGDRVAALFDVYGAIFARIDHPNKFHYHDDDASAVTTDGVVQSAPGAGLSVYITDVVISIGAATASSLFLEEGSTKILGPYYLEAIAGRTIHLRFSTPKKCTANTQILVTNTGSVTFSIDIFGFIAP